MRVWTAYKMGVCTVVREVRVSQARQTLMKLWSSVDGIPGGPEMVSVNGIP